MRIVVSAEQAVSFPLLLRIPAWANDATIAVDNQTETVQQGTFHHLEREWHTSTRITLHLPMSCKTQTRYHNSVTIERGPLVYALKIDEEWRQLRGELPHADWEVLPKSAWNYALEIDREHPERSCKFETYEIGNNPFSPEGAPVAIKVKGRRVPNWTIERNAAGSLPESPVATAEPLKELTLIPYGCTNLRVTEFPTVS